MIPHPSLDAGFGRIRIEDPRDRLFSMADALPADAEKRVPKSGSRRWALLRSLQENQYRTPWCVAGTGKHWEKAQPLSTRSGLPMGELYRRCKLIDGYPNADGTHARALMKVYQDLGMIESYHWGLMDRQAHDLWLLAVGGIWWGAYWTKSMFEPGPGAHLTVTGRGMYGHEVFVLGYHRALDAYEFANTWGLPWGDRGRGYIKAAEYWALNANGGDVAGAMQRKP